MALEKITHVSGKAVPVPGDDVDTDRIIPARFMKCVTFDGLGEYAFYDVRYNEDGSKKEHPLNAPHHQDAAIMVVGSNFGCGSSREHAPQALHKFGIRALIGESFAEIFFGNSTTLGMPCVSVSPEDRQTIAKAIASAPETIVRIDLEKMTVTIGEQSFSCTMPDSAHEALLAGEWDPIALMLDKPEAIDNVAQGLHYV